jgi:hypothetical protein
MQNLGHQDIWDIRTYKKKDWEAGLSLSEFGLYSGNICRVTLASPCGWTLM